MSIKQIISFFRVVLGVLVFLNSITICLAQVNSQLFGYESDSFSDHQNFHIELKIVSLDERNFQLVSVLDLVEGSFIYSPLSRDDFYLPYSISVLENSFISARSALTEFPASSIEQDPYIEKEVRIIRSKTVFTQAYTIEKVEDFEVKGLIEFLLEPACIPYDLTFSIKMQSGVLSIQNEKLFISSEYKP